MVDKIRVHYVGGLMSNPGEGKVWGGAVATNYAIKKAFEKSDKYKLVMRSRNSFESIQEVNQFLNASDISWVDETSITQKLFVEGLDRPNVLGPVCRSPVKRYNNGLWDSIYSPEWFYSGQLLRLNENEEKSSCLKEEYKDTNWESQPNYIRHAVDTDYLKPVDNPNRKYILWAGQANRPAKNFEMFQKIKEKIDELGGLPEPYEFKVMSGYSIEEYFDVLDETALVINTSKYESFCCAAAEAMSKGVPILVRNNFNGNMFKDRPIQVEYEVNAYINKIMELVDNKKQLDEEGKKAREYAVKNFSLETMKNDIEEVFDKVREEQWLKK